MMTIDKALNIIAEKTYQNTQDINRKNLQRRHQVVDLFGVPYASSGDQNSPAEFYISISPDMEYLERFQFKLIVTDFISSIGGLSATASGNTGDQDLDVVNITYDAQNERVDFSQIDVSPDPHNHTIDNISFSATAGVTKTPTTSTTWRVTIMDQDRQNEVDISAYLMLQYNGRWMHGGGIYPSQRIDHDYDLLQVACDLEAEGNTTARKLITSGGGKWIRVYSDSPFGITLINYLKYSHLNR